MELILINSSKLKIMLTDDEMKKYELDTETLDYDTTSTRRAFWSILDDAKTRTGFDAASDRVFIQLYPSKKGGCEMYVTKLGDAVRSARDGRVSRGVQLVPAERLCERRRLTAYAFEALESLLCVCRRLLTREWTGQSEAYRDHLGKFFLFLTVGCAAYPPDNELSFISEYGTAENAEHLRLYISEYGSCICEENAVEQLGIL